MLLTTLLKSIYNSKKRWFIGGAIAILATIVGDNTTALADIPNRLSKTLGTNGVYLYGESNRPEMSGKEYIIFERIGNKAVGAFYLPRSEFNCFKGQFQGSRLNVTLTDAFDRQKYNFSLNLNARGLTASKLPTMGEPTYQPLGKISDNDQRILSACKLQLPN
ncbi:MAG: hypothetical protein LH474_08240 [Chamaesiphon sp.]|nr:hypothetical protein [Chamaesiphon sp.]